MQPLAGHPSAHLQPRTQQLALPRRLQRTLQAVGQRSDAVGQRRHIQRRQVFIKVQPAAAGVERAKLWGEWKRPLLRAVGPTVPVRRSKQQALEPSQPQGARKKGIHLKTPLLKPHSSLTAIFFPF